jgi:cell division protein FtsN
MTTTDCATEIPAQALPPQALQGESSQDAERSPKPSPPSFSSEASKPLRSLLWGFGATVTIGLTLATWYVGVRIVAADEVAPPPAQAVQAAAPLQNLYLQVAGLGAQQDAGFVRSLQAKGFEAQVQGGDRADNASVLIGPFATPIDLEQAQRKLQSLGVLAIETAH